MPRPLTLEALAVAVAVAIPLPKWWSAWEDDPDVQKNASIGLAAAYSTIALVALIQLIRIQVRVPEYGWTTQKVFHLLNCLVCGFRGAIFARAALAPDSTPAVPGEGYDALLHLALFDLPGLLFFTTYTLLVLFWAEIYHQARSIPTGSLRPMFIFLNVVVYAVQAGFWGMNLYGAAHGNYILERVGLLGSDGFLAAVSLVAAGSFLLYGGRLFLMLQRFPIESRGRRKKMREVGLVTTICAGCFMARALLVGISALDSHDFELDVTTHPLPNVLYYSVVEMLPSACVLYILRKLPPKRNTQGYQQIPTQ